MNIELLVGGLAFSRGTLSPSTSRTHGGPSYPAQQICATSLWGQE